ncbi:hypothetical protein E2986_02867 [Frieseomelitta varia]|uniref:Coiled-coil domain-containing protein 170 n=1 Tax=Frieseomelitta varia TaxID=561572 RepID=A0A833WC91_9HYME|nr:hypothetical protein E2986_02867 [Frieseomelitta varia]
MSSEEEARATKGTREAADERKDATEEDLQIFETLCISSPRKLQETKNLVRSRDQRIVELQIEAEQLREQAARQNAIVLSLKERIQLDRIDGLGTGRTREESLRDSGKKRERAAGPATRLEVSPGEKSGIREEDTPTGADREFARKLANALSVEYRETVHPSPEIVIHKVEELVQEASRVRTKNTNVEAQLTTVEVDFRSCRDALDRVVAEKEQLQRQVSSQLVDLDRLRQDKECVEMRCRVADREVNELRDKLLNANRSISSATGNISNQEALIGQLREDLMQRDEKCQRVQTELRHLLESLAMLVNGPNRFIESHENVIKDRIREILAENKDQALMIQKLREKVNTATESTTRQSELIDTTVAKMRNLEDERSELQSKVRKLEAELADCELSKESLRREKQTLVTFLDRLGKAMQMDEISEEMGLDLQTESLLVRAEQLARLETDKLVDKTSVVYQLQRRVRTLREQLQRRDLHLDLLRRKLSLQEDSVKMKSLLQSERDEANLRAKKLSKQIDRLQAQLLEERSRNRELSAQLTEAADYKIAALERSRKIEEVQKRLVESEMLRTRCNRKLTLLKEQIRSTTETAEQERSISDHSLQLLRDEMAQVKQNLSELTKRESQLQSFRVSVVKLLSEPICTPDYEIISRLQKIVAAHRDFTMLSRRYDEPLDTTSPSRCTSIHAMHPPRSPGSRCARYEDSGFADPPDLRDVEDEFNKRPVRSSLLP